MYESLVFFAWCITLFYILLELKFKVAVLGAFVMPLAVTTMAYASLSTTINQDITPLVPALQSNWLIAHVITCGLSRFLKSKRYHPSQHRLSQEYPQTEKTTVKYNLPKTEASPLLCPLHSQSSKRTPTKPKKIDTPPNP